ncbi:transposase [Massilia sp. CF038]|uniref:transposase n=1 Tax=Massilia sp. CF038 TaxID=1881045 RepID=UPI00091A6C9F|nr:transposase [Massilia sp. CF038]SHH65531.1 putative transposase [Massilia sp. CF038]
MARLPRLVVANYPHHIIQSGNNNQAIFREDEDYQRFLGWLKESAKEFKVAIHAYALMQDHLHLLATPATVEGLAQTMQRVGRYYVPWYNAKYARSGGLFQGRFKTSLIDPERYFMLVSRYIETNAVRNLLVSDPLHYPWSSYPHHTGIKPDSVITDHALYWALGNTPFQREAAYIELSRPSLSPAEREAVDAAVLKGWPLGSDKFKAELQLRAKRQVLPAKRGRPFKKPVEAT